MWDAIYTSSGGGTGGLGSQGCVLRTAVRCLLKVWALGTCKLFMASIFLSKKKKGWACLWSTLVSGTCVISLTWCGAFEENVAVVLLKNNKSYGIPLNSENVGNIGRKGTKHFKVLVWRKRFWIKQFYVILQVVWAIILYVRLYHCSLECSYNTDLIMHRKKISHLLDSFLLFKSRKEQKGSYFLKEIVRFYCRKVAACAELEL